MLPLQIWISWADIVRSILFNYFAIANFLQQFIFLISSTKIEIKKIEKLKLKLRIQHILCSIDLFNYFAIANFP